MKKNLIFLGIETSCDETAASVVMQDSKGKAKILSNVVSSQIKIHKKFGGVVPDLASKAHADKIDIIIIYDDEDKSDLEYLRSLKKLDKRIDIIVNKKNLSISRN